MKNDDYLGQIDDDHRTINVPSAGTTSISVRFRLGRSSNLKPAMKE